MTSGSPASRGHSDSPRVGASAWLTVGIVSVLPEPLAQLAREGLRLTGVADLAAEEAAVVAREHARLLAEQLGRGDCGATGEGARRLLAHGDHDARRGRGQRVD